MAMILVKNAFSPAETKPYSQNAIGKRQHGDELLYFVSRNVTNNSRFPSKSFEYVGDDTTQITYVGFSFNVSSVSMDDYSLWNVEFSYLQSPTAIAFINSTFVLQNEFSAVTYDMNAEHFVANVSIYGFKNFGAQTVYEEIVEPKEICCWCSYYKKYLFSCGERKSFD